VLICAVSRIFLTERTKESGIFGAAANRYQPERSRLGETEKSGTALVRQLPDHRIPK